MYQIQTLNEISPVGLNILPTTYAVSSDEANPHGILLRSANMHETVFNENLLAIGRAGAGVNNIPLERCSQAGIAVFNTPGANANGVKELVLAGLLLSSRDIVGGIQWTGELAGETDIAKKIESNKSKFAGTEIYGKKLGIIGLGAIGVLVANAATDLGMEVFGIDPYISVESAWNLRPSVKKVEQYAELADCDFISLHIPLVDGTRGVIGTEFIAELKTGVTILNFSRGELVDDNAILTALEHGKVAHYVTDFPNDAVTGKLGVIGIPHLGASTQESEDNCAKMAARELKEYLEYGNITNSVNFPDCALPYSGGARLTIIHQNVPTVIARFLEGIASLGLNIDNMINKSKGEIAYTIIDLDGAPTEDLVKTINQSEEVIRTRVVGEKR